MICKTCGNTFTRFVIHDGRKLDLHGRKNCLNCFPYGKLNYPAKKKEKMICHCKICGKDFKNFGIGNKCKSCYGIEARHKLKKKMVEYKGGSCQKCGYNKSLWALQFHHLDPQGKKFQIGGNFTRKFDILKKELDKCLLLCANCHAEEHEKLPASPWLDTRTLHQHGPIG